MLVLYMKHDYGSLYWVYAGMKNRCYNRRHPSYSAYGGRGIRVCPRWSERITGFVNFVADMGERPKGMQLDRIDLNDDFTPENCIWLGRNARRPTKGKLKALA